MVLPSRLSRRGAAAFRVILGGRPIGLRTVIFSPDRSKTSSLVRSLGVVTMFMGTVPDRRSDAGDEYKTEARASIGPALPSSARLEIAEGRDRRGAAVARRPRQL